MGISSPFKKGKLKKGLSFAKGSPKGKNDDKKLINLFKVNNVHNPSNIIPKNTNTHELALDFDDTRLSNEELAKHGRQKVIQNNNSSWLDEPIISPVSLSIKCRNLPTIITTPPFKDKKRSPSMKDSLSPRRRDVLNSNELQTTTNLKLSLPTNFGNSSNGKRLNSNRSRRSSSVN